jgi:acetyl-CoA C-acetyltransferase
VAREQVNQSAAVVLTSLGLARQLGIPASKFVFLHGAATVYEKLILQREYMGTSNAAVQCAKLALSQAQCDVREVDLVDFYSCFPIAVSNLVDGLVLRDTSSCSWSVTGGLPFFGGPGSNYSMHAVVQIVQLLRQRGPRSRGLVTANGGYLSSHAAGVYSGAPRAFRPVLAPSAQLQAQLDAAPRVAVVHDSNALSLSGVVETYTIDHMVSPPRVIVIARRDGDGARFVAASSLPNKGEDVSTPTSSSRASVAPPAHWLQCDLLCARVAADVRVGRNLIRRIDCVE